MKAVYHGIADEMIRLVQEEQLKDRALWELAAKQFLGAPDDADLGWRGEYWGKLMRGACMTWQYTKDSELYDILTDAVKDLLAAQEADGRISTYSREAELQGWDIWCRKYVLLGLIHFYETCREKELAEKVLEAAGRHLDYIIDHIGAGEGRKKITLASNNWRGINSSSILEPVVRLYQWKPEKRYLEFADYIVETGGAEGFDIFQAAFEDRMYPYQYPVVKAYELMSCFEGLLVYARVKGEERWRQAVVRFADRLLESEATIVGGSGCEHELFNHSSLMQTGTVYQGLMLETCVTVTWMKLMARVYEMTGDMRYLEEVERAAFNALYGAVNTEYSTCGPEATFDEPSYRGVYDRSVSGRGGRGQMFDSYSPLRSGIRGRAVGGFKSMEEGTAYCGCCIAIGAAGTALVPALAVRERRDGAEPEVCPSGSAAGGRQDGVELGIYLPGTVTAEIGGVPVELEVDTCYPVEGEISVKVHADREIRFPLWLRIPSFAESGRVFVNEEEQAGVVPGTFFELRRSWKEDRIRVSLKFGPRLAYGMENPQDSGSSRHVAVLYGPLALARDARLGTEGTPVRVGDGKISVSAAEAGIPCQCCFRVNMGGEEFLMIDYASAGKSWRRDSQMEVWMESFS